MERNHNEYRISRRGVGGRGRKAAAAGRLRVYPGPAGRVITVLMAAATLVLAAVPVMAGEKEPATGEHPPLTAAEKLIPCSQCHQEQTPDIYRQWYDSRHGIGMVKCYQCHGTYEDLKVVPEKRACEVCHTAAMEKCPPEAVCWQCHGAHLFKVEGYEGGK